MKAGRVKTERHKTMVNWIRRYNNPKRGAWGQGQSSKIISMVVQICEFDVFEFGEGGKPQTPRFSV